MSKTKLLTTFLLAFALLFAQVGAASAAPQAQDVTTITGAIQSIVIVAAGDGNPIVTVTLLDDQGATQTVQLSVEDAVAIGLITLDANTSDPVVNEELIGETIDFDPALVTMVEETEEESNHIISTLLGVFFGEDAGVIDTYHEDGYGFGVIAQAFWMSQNFSDDASLVGDILVAKQDKDFEAFFEAHPEYLVDGEDVPTNWGQFKKAFSNKKNNLGSVVSGKADDATNEESAPGNGHGKDKSDKGKDKSKGKGKNK